MIKLLGQLLPLEEVVDEPHPRRVALRRRGVSVLEVPEHVAVQDFPRLPQLPICPAAFFRQPEKSPIVRETPGDRLLRPFEGLYRRTAGDQLEQELLSLELGVLFDSETELRPLTAIRVPVHRPVHGKLVDGAQPGQKLLMDGILLLQPDGLLQQKARKPALPANVQEVPGGEVVHPRLGVLPPLPGVEVQEGLRRRVVRKGVGALVNDSGAVCQGPAFIFRFRRLRYGGRGRSFFPALGIGQRRLIGLPQLHEPFRVLLRVAGLGPLRVGPLDGGNVFRGLQAQYGPASFMSCVPAPPAAPHRARAPPRTGPAGPKRDPCCRCRPAAGRRRSAAA